MKELPNSVGSSMQRLRAVLAGALRDGFVSSLKIPKHGELNALAEEIVNAILLELETYLVDLNSETIDQVCGRIESKLNVIQAGASLSDESVEAIRSALKTGGADNSNDDIIDGICQILNNINKDDKLKDLRDYLISVEKEQKSDKQEAKEQSSEEGGSSAEDQPNSNLPITPEQLDAVFGDMVFFDDLMQKLHETVTQAIEPISQTQSEILEIGESIVRRMTKVIATNLKLISSQAALVSSNMALASSNVTLAGSNFALAGSNMTVAASNMALAGSNVVLAGAKLALAMSNLVLAAANIALAITVITSVVTLMVTVVTAAISIMATIIASTVAVMMTVITATITILTTILAVAGSVLVMIAAAVIQLLAVVVSIVGLAAALVIQAAMLSLAVLAGATLLSVMVLAAGAMLSLAVLAGATLLSVMVLTSAALLATAILITGAAMVIVGGIIAATTAAVALAIVALTAGFFIAAASIAAAVLIGTGAIMAAAVVATGVLLGATMMAIGAFQVATMLFVGLAIAAAITLVAVAIASVVAAIVLGVILLVVLIEDMIDGVKEKIAAWWEKSSIKAWWDDVQAAGGLWPWVKLKWEQSWFKQNVVDPIVAKVNDFVKWVTGIWENSSLKKWWDGVQAKGGLWSWIKDSFINSDFYKNIITPIKNAIDRVVNWISEFSMSKLADSIVGWVKKKWNAMMSGLAGFEIKYPNGIDIGWGKLDITWGSIKPFSGLLTEEPAVQPAEPPKVNVAESVTKPIQDLQEGPTIQAAQMEKQSQELGGIMATKEAADEQRQYDYGAQITSMSNSLNMFMQQYNPQQMTEAAAAGAAAGGAAGAGSIHGSSLESENR